MSRPPRRKESNSPPNRQQRTKALSNTFTKFEIQMYVALCKHLTEANSAEEEERKYGPICFPKKKYSYEYLTNYLEQQYDSDWVQEVLKDPKWAEWARQAWLDGKITNVEKVKKDGYEASGEDN